MKIQNSKCLVLNADYTPLGIINWQRALVWSLEYGQSSKMSIDIIDFYKDDWIIGASNKKYAIPAVAKTNKYYKLHQQSVNFSRKNLFIRDNYTCQYCYQKKEIHKLTYDHVIPKSKWKYENSPTCWTNIVTACVDCNRKKGNKTPAQANMVLKTPPYQPAKNLKYLPVVGLLINIRSDIPSEWHPYLPASYFSKEDSNEIRSFSY
jgi:hypothetical protein